MVLKIDRQNQELYRPGDDNRCLNECDELLTDRKSDGGDVAYLRRKKKKKKKEY